MIIEWLHYKAATCSAIVKCDLMRPLWACILRGLYLGQNSPSRLKLGRHLHLIAVIFLFGLRKWNYYSAVSPPIPIFSKVCIYSHINCGLLSLSDKMQGPKDVSRTCEQLDLGFPGQGLTLSQAIARRDEGNRGINNEVGGDVRKARALGLLPCVSRSGALPGPCSRVRSHPHTPFKLSRHTSDLHSPHPSSPTRLGKELRDDLGSRLAWETSWVSALLRRGLVLCPGGHGVGLVALPASKPLGEWLLCCPNLLTYYFFQNYLKHWPLWIVRTFLPFLRWNRFKIFYLMFLYPPSDFF